jgi:hypothetical protein
MQHATETRAEVLALHMAGESQKAIVRKLGVPLTTVRRWITEGVPAPPAPKTKGWLDEQVWGLIADTIASIRAVARQAQDPVWLGKQNANDLAVYSGVQTDKLIRVLGALQLNDDDGADAGETGTGAVVPR